MAPAVHLEQQVFPTTGSSQIHLDCSRQAQTVNTPHLLSIYPFAQGHQQLSTAHFHMNYTAGTIKLSCEEPPIFPNFNSCLSAEGNVAAFGEFKNLVELNITSSLDRTEQ